MTLVATFDKFQGLSNRIKNIASCYRMSDDVEILWDTEVSRVRAQLNVQLKDFFPYLKETFSVEGKQTRIGWRLEVFPNDLPENFWGDPNVYRTTCAGKNCIDFHYDKIPEKVQESYIEAFDKIKFHPKIVDLANTFADQNFNDDTISVHIRTWFDCGQRRIENYEDTNRYIPNGIKNYFYQMDKYPEGKFFISLDNYWNEILPQFYERYGKDRIISYNNPKYRHGMVDLLLLSKNKNFVASPCSTFSEVAWWLSKCKSNVNVAWKFKNEN